MLPPNPTRERSSVNRTHRPCTFIEVIVIFGGLSLEKIVIGSCCQIQANQITQETIWRCCTFPGM
eukprot:m.312530 g.312530  ORF g.312530 m.312530 type:complete len:65 (+) comp277764_c0_seq1:337-531(+)